MSACVGLLEPRGSGLGLLKSKFNAENFIRRLLWSISSHFVAIQCWNVHWIQKLWKIHLKPLLWVHGRSRSPMFTNQKSLSPVLVTISSTSVPICNRFHTIRANNGKITTFRGYPYLTPSFEGNPSSRGTKFCHEKLETLRQPTVKISWS